MRIRSIISIMAAAAAISSVSCSKSAKESGPDAAADKATPTESATEAPAVVEITGDVAIPPADGKLRVLDFNATWCGPCRQFAPNFHAVAAKYNGKAAFYSIDVDQNPRLAAQYNIQSIPTVVYVQPDGTTTSTSGYMDRSEFDNAVAALIK